MPVARGVSWQAPEALAPLLAAFEPAVIGTAVQASVKLLFLCALVAWMSHRGALPPGTSTVLSKVSAQQSGGAHASTARTATTHPTHTPNQQQAVFDEAGCMPAYVAQVACKLTAPSMLPNSAVRLLAGRPHLCLHPPAQPTRRGATRSLTCSPLC